MENHLDLKFERLLGEGSYGKVFLVSQTDGQQFAVKEIDLTKCDGNGREQAHGEANLLARLRHGNILLYVESVICDECLYIVTEYCEGGDLEDYLQLVSKKRCNIPESLVSSWILQIGEALKYLHDHKILHRDMKTKNIFLKDDLSAKLGDLGIAKVLDLNQSKADTFVGTPSYMSPELFSGKSYNHKTDIWGLGCCAYEMMTLKRAFQGKALWVLIREIKFGHSFELPDMYSLEIRTLVQDMMQQKPEDRPSAKDIVQNELLLYHKGAAHDEDVKRLPRPHERSEEKQKTRNSHVLQTGSGSFKHVIEQMDRSKEEKFRNTVESVCEKINTLRVNKDDEVDADEYSTFVYKGDDEDNNSGDELEAQGTILDGSLLKIYTQQLDTFVNKETTVGSYNTVTGNKVGSNDFKDTNDRSGDEEDMNNSLLRQYSETLEEEEWFDAEENREDAGGGVEDELGDLKSPEHSNKLGSTSKLKTAELEDTARFQSKYQFKGLKDTFALRPDKKWHHGDARHLFSPQSADKYMTSNKSVDRGHSQENENKGSKSKGLSLSLSFTEERPSKTLKEKVADPRLNQSLRDKSDSAKQRTAKVKTSEMIEKTTKLKLDEDARKKARKKSLEKTDLPVAEYNIEGADVNVQDMISHFQENLSPMLPDSASKIITSNGSDSQEHSTVKGKKKKANYLKKHSGARRILPEVPDEGHVVQRNGVSDEVKLFTRAQSARFSKNDDDSDEGCT